MTKDDFIRRHQAQQKHGNALGVLWIVLFFAILGANAYFARHLDAQPKHVQILYGIAIFAFLLGQFPILIWYSRRATRRFGLRCPSCDKPLTGISAQIAIASEHCGHCGSKLFSDGEPPSTPNDRND
jgi:hypothetical protein